MYDLGVLPTPVSPATSKAADIRFFRPRAQFDQYGLLGRIEPLANIGMQTTTGL